MPKQVRHDDRPECHCLIVRGINTSYMERKIETLPFFRYIHLIPKEEWVMNRSTHTQPGTWPLSRNLKAALIALGVLAAAVFFTVPAFAQDDFPWATKVSIDSPSREEIFNNAKNGGYLPNWVKTRYDPNDITTIYPLTGYASFLQLFKRNPHFTTDGTKIVFDDMGPCSWIVPASGGEPDIIGEWKATYELKRTAEGKYYVEGGVMGVGKTYGLSPDGKGILGVLRMVDPEKGDVVKVTVRDVNGTQQQSVAVYFNAHQIVLKSISGGEYSLLAADAIYGQLSHSGRLLVYAKRDPYLNVYPDNMDDHFAYEAMITGMYVKDLATGNEWRIAKLATYPCFSADDSAVFCSMKDANGLWQIFRIPVEGGTPTQITFYSPNDSGRNARVSDISPDGRWIVHTGDYTVGSDTKTGLCVCNVVSGISYPLFPQAQNTTTEGSWSPDGRKIVFSASCPNFENGVRILDKYEIYIYDFNPDAFGKTTDVADALPSGFAITGNSPNPFNPSTAISYSLPKAGTALLAVYDITGRKVCDLAAGPMTAGAHSAVWDGRDASGHAVSSGVYIARLVLDGRAVSRKMMLMK